MLRTTTLFGLSLLGASLLATVAVADVYRYVDKNGQVQYTDRPEKLPAEILAKIKSKRTDNSALADQVAADLQARDAAAKAQAATSKDQAEKQKAAATTAADKADRCTRARNQYANVSQTGRVYTLDAKGERVYMDDTELEKTRASAKADMDTWCE